MAKKRKQIDLNQLEEYSRQSLEDGSLNLATLLTKAVRKAGLWQEKNRDIVKFYNKDGLNKLSRLNCSKLEKEARQAISEKQPLPENCQNCRKIIIHPKVDKVSYLTSFIGLLDGLKEVKHEFPISGVALKKPLKKESERIVLTAHKNIDFMHLLHSAYMGLQNGSKYNDSTNQPLFTLHFLADKNTPIYVRYGCAILRDYAKAWRRFSKYFEHNGFMYKNVPVKQTRVQTSF